MKNSKGHLVLDTLTTLATKDLHDKDILKPPGIPYTLQRPNFVYTASGEPVHLTITATGNHSYIDLVGTVNSQEIKQRISLSSKMGNTGRGPVWYFHDDELGHHFKKLYLYGASFVCRKRLPFSIYQSKLDHVKKPIKRR